MNKNIIVILFLVIVVGAISLFVNYSKQFMPKYKWDELYKKEYDQPYGLKLFYELLEENSSDVTNIKRSFNKTLDTSKTNSNYIAIGEYLYIDSLRANHILKYAENGNSVFIVAKNAPLEITRMFLTVQDSIFGYEVILDSIVDVSFSANKQHFSFHRQEFKDTALHFWSAYTKSYFNDTLSQSGFEAVSFLNKNINCYTLNWGEGKIIIHSNPILFTNYNIIAKKGFTNANNILSHLNNGPIFWDELSQKETSSSGVGGDNPGSNPFQFLFSHYTLRWGWYLFLITVVIYLLVRTKREQRIIPVLQKNTNTSIAYTKAVGVLYFQKGQHKLIANEMFSLLLANIRGRYNIVTTKEEDLIESISAKSGIDKKTITTLFKHFRKVRFSPMANSKDLINLHSAVESYYKNCN